MQWFSFVLPHRPWIAASTVLPAACGESSRCLAGWMGLAIGVAALPMNDELARYRWVAIFHHVGSLCSSSAAFDDDPRSALLPAFTALLAGLGKLLRRRLPHAAMWVLQLYPLGTAGACRVWLLVEANADSCHDGSALSALVRRLRLAIYRHSAPDRRYGYLVLSLIVFGVAASVSARRQRSIAGWRNARTALSRRRIGKAQDGRPWRSSRPN